jgi:hypothetical protein
MSRVMGAKIPFDRLGAPPFDRTSQDGARGFMPGDAARAT